MLEAPETSNVVPLEIAAVVVNKVVLTASLNVVAPPTVNCAGLYVAPIVLANVGVPVILIVPSPAAAPLIVPVIVFPVPENVAVAVDVLLSKLIVVTVTVFANVACEFSALESASPPTILIFVPVTVPLNDAEPALAELPTAIVSAAMLPENVISEILLSLLLIT